MRTRRRVSREGAGALTWALGGAQDHRADRGGGAAGGGGSSSESEKSSRDHFYFVTGLRRRAPGERLLRRGG